ncbi:hypothetical protein [Brevibacterium sp. 239c]|uniref:hypothetical protein n=1 Tax=Brevibacterium sp. 239c TaxID=1965356 RepID=UPI0011AF85DF|nr:hypothetical protein [Brevibacterium sp. 239c]
MGRADSALLKLIGKRGVLLLKAATTGRKWNVTTSRAHPVATEHSDRSDDEFARWRTQGPYKPGLTK